MPRVYFEVPLPNYATLVNHTNPVINGAVVAAQNDPLVHFLPNKNRIDFELSFKDILEKHRGLLGVLPMGGGSGDRLTWLTQYATKAFFEDQEKFLDETRDVLRADANGDLPDGTHLQDPADPGLTDAMTAAQGAAHLLGANDGVCLGGDHTDQNTKDFLYDNLTANNFPGVALIFVEEIKMWMQPMLDAYYNLPDPPNFPLTMPVMHPDLKKALDTLSTNLAIQAPKNFTGVVEEARRKHVRVVGIDRGEADVESKPGVLKKNAVFGEQRCAMMNATSKKIMDEAIADARQTNPNAKFVALMGSEHLNTVPGGVPGLSQLFNAPPVTISATGKLQWEPENTRNRGMPSKEEQAFIDAYLMKVDQGYYGQGGNPDAMTESLKRNLRKDAVGHAARLKAAGKLDKVSQVEKCLKDQSVATGITNYVQNATREMTAPPLDRLKTAIREGDHDDAKTLLVKALAVDNTILTRDITGGSGKTLLHSACVNGHAEIAALLIANGADPDQTPAGGGGQSATHDACNRRPDGEDFLSDIKAAGEKYAGETDYVVALQKRRYGNVMKKLVAAGADLDKQDAQGRTPLHLAALNGQPGSLEELLTNGANAALTDNRGWKPIDVAIGSTKIEAEQVFYTAHAALNQKLVKDTEGQFSTVEILMKATLCEDPNDRQQIETMYKELYTDPLLRPILDLAALDAASNRQPPQLATGTSRGAGLRIMVADHTKDNVGSLYNALGAGKSTPPAAGYDHEANILMMAAGTTKNLKGEVIHELTHMAARAACDKDAIPAKDNQAKADYLQAIEDTVKTMHLMSDDPAEKRVRELMSERMLAYAGRTADTALLQEFIVGIPQMIVEFGEPAVRKYAPKLLKYFEDFGDTCNDVATSAPQFQGALSHIDIGKNRSLANAPKPPVPPLTDAWVTPDGLKGKQKVDPNDNITQLDLLDAVLAKVRLQYTIENGQKGTLPNGITIAFQPDQYELSATEQKDLDKKMKSVKDALKKTMSSDALPRELSADDFRELVKKTSTLVANTPANNLEATLRKEAQRFARKQKVKFVDRAMAKGQALTAKEIAEAVVIKAQSKAWDDQAEEDDALDAIDVNESKHAQMVEMVAGKLSDYDPNTTSAAALKNKIDSASDTLANQPNLLKVKAKYDGKANTDHVSMDSKSKWLKKLATL